MTETPERGALTEEVYYIYFPFISQYMVMELCKKLKR